MVSVSLRQLKISQDCGAQTSITWKQSMQVAEHGLRIIVGLTIINNTVDDADTLGSNYCNKCVKHELRMKHSLYSAD